MVKNLDSLCRGKIPYQQFLMFLSFIIVAGFMNIFRSSRSQVFFKIGALKISQLSELKRDSNTGVFL